jgi:hypothetical protein
MRISLLAIIIAGLPLAAQPGLEVEGRAWFGDPAGTIRVSRSGFGTDVDLKNDLGISGTTLGELRVALKLGHNRIDFGYTPIRLEGDSDVSRTIQFAGQTYTVGTRVQSQVKVDHLSLGWRYLFGNHLIRIGPAVRVNGFLTHSSLASSALSQTQTEDLSFGIPTAGLALELHPVHRLTIFGEATGMSADNYGHFIESDAGVRVYPARFLYGTAGYQTFNLKGEIGSDLARLRIRGPFVGLGLQF